MAPHPSTPVSAKALGHLPFSIEPCFDALERAQRLLRVADTAEWASDAAALFRMHLADVDQAIRGVEGRLFAARAALMHLAESP